MSAYICDPEHFGILAAYATHHDAAIREWEVVRNMILTAQEIAKGLARENIRSVKWRYPHDEDGDRPGPRCMKDADIEEAAAVYAGHFVANPQPITTVQVLKLCQSYRYQSDNSPDWNDTLAARQIDWIMSEAIRRLPGYEDAEWVFDQALPAVEALYWRAP